MDSKLMKPLPKQLMLKDYLLDDLSSCSSSGFRSYPRRQCCTTVRFLLEIDLKNKYPPPPPPYRKNPKAILKSRLKPAPPPPSAFKKASVAVINAMKHLPFTGAKSPLSSSSTSKKKKPMIMTIFPRSISKKLKRSFWKRNDHKEIYWWTTFNRLDKEELKSPVITAITGGDSKNSRSVSVSVSVSVSEGKSESNSWSDSDFTATSNNSLQTSSGNSEVNSTESVNSKKLGSSEKLINGKKVDVTTGDDSTDSTISSHGSTTNFPNTKKPWPNEEKEQFSPVSTLDCPFDDDDEVSSASPFQHKLSRMEGTTKKLMKKIKRFECLTQMEPLNLEKRIVSSESESESPLANSSETENEEEEEKVEEKQTDESKALDLVQELKASMPSYSLKLKAENLLFDFFKERIFDSYEHSKVQARGNSFNNKMLQVAKDWINGKPIEVLSDWKVQENRPAYMRAIESRGEWKNTNLERQEVILELEVEVYASLMDELLLDIILNE